MQFVNGLRSRRKKAPYKLRRKRKPKPKMKSLDFFKILRPVRFTLYLRVARPKRSVGVGRSTSDSHALRTLGVAKQLTTELRFYFGWIS